MVPHQQFRGLLRHLVDPLHVSRGRRGGLNLRFPVGPEVVDEVALEGLSPVELGEGNRREHRIALETHHLLFHRPVHEVEVSHQLAVAGLVHHTLKEAAHKAGVLGHGVGFFGPFPQLGSEGDGHGCR